MRLPPLEWQLPEGRDFGHCCIPRTQESAWHVEDAQWYEWTLAEWPASSCLRSDFTLNPIPLCFLCSTTFAAVLQTRQAQARLGALTLTVPLAGSALPSNLGRAISYDYSCFSSNVPISARLPLVTLPDGSSQLYHIILLDCLHLTNLVYLFTCLLSVFSS